MAKPPAEFGSIATLVLTGLPGRDGLEGSPALQGTPARPRGTRTAGGSRDAPHSSRRRPDPELSSLLGGLGARPAAATLGLSPPGQGCPFRPASLPAPAPRLALSPRPGAPRKAAPGLSANPAPKGAVSRRTSLGPGRPDSPHQIAEPQTHSRHLTTQPPPTHRPPGTSGRPGAAHWVESGHVTGAGCHRPRRCSDVAAPAGAYWPARRHVTREPRSPRAGAERLPAPFPSLRLVTTKRPGSEAAATAAVRPVQRAKEPTLRPAPPPDPGLHSPPPRRFRYGR